MKDPEHWYRFALLLARYHEGKPEESLELSELCLTSSNSYCVACTRIVRAMSLRKLSRLDEASEELNELQQYVEEHASDFQLSPSVHWPNVLYFEALRADLNNG